MKTLKLEPFSGLSGDMFLGLLADLGNAYDALLELPERLGLKDELAIEIESVDQSSIACRHVKIVDKIHEHHHRHLSDVNKIIDASDLPEAVKVRARAIFLDLAQAEADVHGVTVESIHFHEVGAIDSIADIVGAAWLIELLEIGETYCTPVTTGFGFVEMAHGRLPVPAPATQKLLVGMPTQAGEIACELVTPTGAAILRNLKPNFDVPALIEERIGYGPGEKEFKIPNVLRGSLCASKAAAGDQMIALQCNMDDCNGEHLGVEFQQLLLDRGATDVWLQQVIMKKGRPGVILNVLVKQAAFDAVADTVLENTSSIGVRYYPVERRELVRQSRVVETEWGALSVKEVTRPSGRKTIKPENDQVMKLADEHGISPHQI